MAANHPPVSSVIPMDYGPVPMVPSSNLIAPNMGHIFPHSEKPDEIVFVFDDQNNYRQPLESYKLYPASYFVQHERPALTALSQGVGQLLCLYINSKNMATMKDALWGIGTAFHVAPNVLVTADHLVTIPAFLLRGYFFTPSFNFTFDDLKYWLDSLSYPLDGSQPSAECLAELAKKNVWAATIINKSVSREIDSPLCDPYKDLFIVSKDSKNTRAWPHHRDFAFMNTAHSSPVWFLPDTEPKKDEIIAHIGYSIPYSVYPEALDQTGVVNRFHSIFSINRKFISPGHLVAHGTNELGLAHVASTTKGSTGGPIFPLSREDVNHPPSFFGIHLGTFAAMNILWSSALNVRHPAFLAEWHAVVYPHLADQISSLSPEKRQQLKAVLARVSQVSPNADKVKEQIAQLEKL